MSASCPNCGGMGQREAIGRDHGLAVRWCATCNLVFDGIATSGFVVRDGTNGEQLPPDEWEDCVETARAALERAQIAKKLKGRSA